GAPEVRASAAPNTTSPCTWCRTAPSGPRTENVYRRFAAVLATAVASSASAFAGWAGNAARASRYSMRYATVDSTPTAANRTTCPASPATGKRQRVSIADPPTPRKPTPRRTPAQERNEHGAEQSNTARRRQASIADPPTPQRPTARRTRAQERNEHGAEQSRAGPPPATGS